MPDIESRTTGQGRNSASFPFLMLCYFIAYVDRVNISFAGGSMSKDLGLTAAAFGGFGAGIFFLTYFLARSAEQSCFWIASARAPLDRPHHVHLGPYFWRHGFHP